MKKSRGFTLMELMIVVGVIGLFTAVAIPKFMQMLEKANVAATLGNLSAIRSAIKVYYGAYADHPSDISLNTPVFRDSLGATMPGVKCSYPMNAPPKGNGVTSGDSIPSEEGNGWYYDYTTGRVYINSTARDINGIHYTTY